MTQPTDEITTVRIGDKIKISVELIRQLCDMPDRSSATATLVRIVRDPHDGTLCLWLSKAE